MKFNRRLYFLAFCISTGYIFTFNGGAFILLQEVPNIRFHPILFATIWVGLTPVAAILRGVSLRSSFLKDVMFISVLPLSLSIISPFVITDYTWLGVTLLGTGICTYDIYMQARNMEKKKRG